MPDWIDTHVHMDDARFSDAVRQAARAVGVAYLVIPAVHSGNFATVRDLARRWGDAYALGLHPMYLPQDADAALAVLERALCEWRDDPHLVALGEIGLDFFEPHLCLPAMRARQAYCLQAQLRLAQQFDLPVLLHVRRSVDAVLAQLRQTPVRSGIAHAFVGSRQQADQCIALGLKLGFGGAMTFDRATRLQALAADLPLEAIVLETDAPDIAPSWLHATVAQRAAGVAQGINTPAQIPRIGQVLADLRGVPLEEIKNRTSANAGAVLPRLQALVAAAPA